MAYSGYDFDFIGLDFHAATTAIALLAAPELPIDGLQVYRNGGRQTGESGNEAFAVRFAGGFES